MAPARCCFIPALAATIVAACSPLAGAGEARLNELLGYIDRANSEIAEISVRLKGETDESTKRDLMQKRDDRLLRLENHKRGLAQLEACRTKRSR